MSKIEYRAVIILLRKEGLAPVAIKRLDGVYGEVDPLYSTVKEREKQFCLGKQSIEDGPREGRPGEVVSEENISRIEGKTERQEAITYGNISKTGYS
jgi:hypothetical protein